MKRSPRFTPKFNPANFGQNGFKIDLANNKALREEFDKGVAAGTEVVMDWLQKVFLRDYQDVYPNLLKDLNDCLQKAYSEKQLVDEGKSTTVAESLPVISV